MYFMFKRIFFLWLFNIHDLTHTPLFLFVNGFCITVGSPVPALITPSRTTWWRERGHSPGPHNTYLYDVVE